MIRFVLCLTLFCAISLSSAQFVKNQDVPKALPILPVPKPIQEQPKQKSPSIVVEQPKSVELAKIAPIKVDSDIITRYEKMYAFCQNIEPFTATEVLFLVMLRIVHDSEKEKDGGDNSFTKKIYNMLTLQSDLTLLNIKDSIKKNCGFVAKDIKERTNLDQQYIIVIIDKIQNTKFITNNPKYIQYNGKTFNEIIMSFNYDNTSYEQKKVIMEIIDVVFDSIMPQIKQVCLVLIRHIVTEYISPMVALLKEHLYALKGNSLAVLNSRIINFINSFSEKVRQYSIKNLYQDVQFNDFVDHLRNFRTIKTNYKVEIIVGDTRYKLTDGATAEILQNINSDNLVPVNNLVNNNERKHSNDVLQNIDNNNFDLAKNSQKQNIHDNEMESIGSEGEKSYIQQKQPSNINRHNYQANPDNSDINESDELSYENYKNNERSENDTNLPENQENIRAM